MWLITDTHVTHLIFFLLYIRKSYIFRHLPLFDAYIQLLVSSYENLFYYVHVLLNLHITNIICTIRWCCKCLTRWTGWNVQRVCAALKTTITLMWPLPWQGMLYTFIKADKTVAALYILNITTVQSLQRITINVTENSPSWEANSCSSTHSIPNPYRTCQFITIFTTAWLTPSHLISLPLLSSVLTYTGCPRRNGQNFGRVFLMLKYTDITQSTYVQSW